MVLTAAQTTAFFRQPAQMGLPATTIAQMAQEGIETVEDLSEFTKEDIDNLASTLRKMSAPGARPAANFTFGAKSQKRLAVAAEIVRYYEVVGRPLSATNMKWSDTLKNFEIQWKSIKDRKDRDKPETPKITKNTTVMKWAEAFKDHCHRIIGARNIALIYVIRQDDQVPAEFPEQGENIPHAKDYESIDQELILRASHDHPLFRVDNEQVYMELETATRGTQYAAAIAPHQRRKNGRAAYLALIGQFAGVDKWEAELKAKESILHTWKWKGQSGYRLELFAAQHRAAYVSMVQCAEHVEYQLPNGHSRVGYLLSAIENSDPELQAAMAMIRADPEGMRTDFEAAVAHLLPRCPVARRKAANRRPSAMVAAIGQGDDEPPAATVAAFGGKVGKGPKTGVQLRYHTKAEYSKLSKDERTELHEWREQSGQKRKPKSMPNSPSKKVRFSSDRAIAAAVEKQVSATLQSLQDERKQGEDLEAFVMACIDKKQQPTSSATVNTASANSALKSIINRAKNQRS